MGRRFKTIVVAVVLFVVVVTLWTVETPFMIIAAGPLVKMTEIVSFSSIPADTSDPHPSAGRVNESSPWLMPTVSAKPATIGNLLLAGLSSNVDLVPRQQLLPAGHDMTTFLAANRQLMRESQTVAAYVAYRWSGRDSSIQGDGAEVLGVWPGTPAARAGIHRGDIIVLADGKPVGIADDLREVLRKATGQIEVEVIRNGKREQLMLPALNAQSRDEGDNSYADLGMILSTYNLRATFDPPIDFVASDVSGPSGGLVIALFIADQLQSLNVPPTATIAATGTLHTDGSVGGVGGVLHKIAAAAAAEVDLFLAPEINLQSIESPPTDTHRTEVLGVTSFEEAVNSLTDYFQRRYNGSVPGGGAFAR